MPDTALNDYLPVLFMALFGVVFAIGRGSPDNTVTHAGAGLLASGAVLVGPVGVSMFVIGGRRVPPEGQRLPPRFSLGPKRASLSWTF